MTFLPVPWAVEGGAENVTEGARILAYAATQAGDGVVGAGDLKVTPTATASAAVAVSTGAAIIRCRASGYAQQTYIASRPKADDFPAVAPVGGSGTRYDMVVAIVKNPWLASESWPKPVDVAKGPYVEAVVLSNVGEDAATDPVFARAYLRNLSLSAIPLAGLVLPAGTNSVLAGNIVDLRRIANPKTSRRLLVNTPAARANVPASWGSWIEPDDWLVDVPEWATHMTFVATVLGAKLDKQSSTVDGSGYGQLRLQFGDNNPRYSTSTKYDFSAPKNSGATRGTVGVADTMLVPPEWRDTLQPLILQGDELEGGNQPLYVDTSSSAYITVEFTERAV